MSRPLGAQRPLIIDVGVAAARFADDDATAFGPAIRLVASGTRGRLFGTAEGGSIVTFGAASAYGSLSAGVRSSLGAKWLGDVSGELASVAGSNSNGGAGTSIGSARLTWNGESYGTWIRGTGHLAARANSTLNGAGADVGAWWTLPRAQLSASVLREWTQAELYADPFRIGFMGTTPVRYTEAAVGLHAEGDRATLDVSVGARRDRDAARLYEPVLNATMALWTGERSAFVISASRQQPDWIRGADAADVFSIAMRFRQPTPAGDRSARTIAVVYLTESPDGRTLSVRAAGARSVDIMGDFTGWEPEALTRYGSTFARAVTISPGSHRLLVRVDGGAWRPAANTPTVDDDLGGRAGLLVVP